MPVGLTLQITDTTNATRVTRVFPQFPVRIGRNPLNDLQICEPFVSQFHAVLEEDGGKLLLRDLGSLNGTRLDVGRAPAHQPVDLGMSNSSFRIGTIAFQGIITSIEAVPRRSQRMALGAPGQTVRMTRVLDEPPRLDRTLAFSPGGVGTTLDYASKAPSAVPEVPEDEHRRLLAQVALQGVIELGKLYLPKQRLDTPEDIAVFLSKLRDTVDVFVRSFIPLRDGYRQFATQMDLKPSGRSADRQGGGGVLTAKTEQALTERLLDLEDEAGAAHKGVEGMFADLMIHQLALLNAIMRGVKSLLQELSPASIDTGLAQLAQQGKTGFAWGPWRFKELWRIYAARYADVDDGDKRTFATLFGKDFAAAYSEFRVGAGAADTSSPSPQR